MDKIQVKKLSAWHEGGTRDRIRRDQDNASEKLRPILACIAEHLFEPWFDVSWLKENAGFKRALRGRFRGELKETPSQYLRRHRMETAVALLTLTEIPVSMISQLVGFTHPTVFSRDFKKWSNLSPRSFRRQYSAAKGRSEGDPRHAVAFWRRALLGTLPANEARHLVASVESRLQLGTRSRRVRTGTENSPVVLEVGSGAFLGDKAAAVFRALWQLPHQDRLLALRQKIRFSPDVLFQELRERCLVEGRKNRRHGVEVAEMALASIQANEAALGDRYRSCLAVAWAVLGNAHRLADDPAAAEAAFDSAHRELSAAAPVDQLAKAEVLDLEASLCLFQRRFSKAEALLDRAIALARAFDGRLLLARSLVQRVSLLIYRGELGPALADLQVAAREVVGLGDTRLELGIQLNLVAICAWRGDSARGWRVLEAARSRCDPTSEPLLHLQMMTLEGILYANDGQRVRAADLLAAAREGLVQRGEVGQAAMVSLELAIVRHHQGRYQETARLAADAVPVFQSLKVDREAIAAAEVLRQAIATGEISKQLLLNARDLLRRLHHLSATLAANPLGSG